MDCQIQIQIHSLIKKQRSYLTQFPSLSKKIVDLGTTRGEVVERQISAEG
jgi:hypothetical protein